MWIWLEELWKFIIKVMFSFILIINIVYKKLFNVNHKIVRHDAAKEMHCEN